MTPASDSILARYPDLQRLCAAEIARSPQCCGGDRAIIQRYAALARQRDAASSAVPRLPQHPETRKPRP